MVELSTMVKGEKKPKGEREPRHYVVLNNDLFEALSDRNIKITEAVNAIVREELEKQGII